MADNVVKDFQDGHEDDLSEADGWASELGYEEDQYPGAIVQWFAVMDTNVLTERAKTIEQLGASGTPFTHVFGASSPYEDLLSSWTTGDATAFSTYVGDGASSGLRKYLAELQTTAAAHAAATKDYCSSIDSLLTGVRAACDDHLGDFKEELGWLGLKAFFAITDPAETLEYFLEAVVRAADEFEGHVTSLGQYSDMMGPDWVPTVGDTAYTGDSRGPDNDDDVDWEDHQFAATDPYSLTGESARSEDEIPGGENYEGGN
ncbi:hypothetical protein O1R50_03430 [Glycomyces luteolus]|uniref:Uncharacterized protein n=1 Tax=Glycomyces luteolus TaxID=2670330 RepID=A0A9X3P5F8_9ACTN|nr:hypothetical protein [Glycomyces luteolus]MDA1358657.1 hypothetical protein [Glycomyces luteolus]